MEEQIRQGNMNPGIGPKPVGEGITEFREKNGGRILVRESIKINFVNLSEPEKIEELF